MLLSLCPESHFLWETNFPGIVKLGFPDSWVDKESASNAGDPGSILGTEDPLEKG